MGLTFDLLWPWKLEKTCKMVKFGPKWRPSWIFWHVEKNYYVKYNRQLTFRKSSKSLKRFLRYPKFRYYYFNQAYLYFHIYSKEIVYKWLSGPNHMEMRKSVEIWWLWLHISINISVSSCSIATILGSKQRIYSWSSRFMIIWQKL